MKSIYFHIFYWFLLVTISSNSYAQEYLSSGIQNYFTEINVDEGLSSANVNAIAKDKAGFIWIGTEYGLNRYDGNSIRNYQSSSQVKTRISSNYIYDIIADNNGDLWVATLDGLNKYRHLSDNFKLYKEKNTKNIYPDIEYDTLTNRIWIAANTGGLKYLDLAIDSLVNCVIDIEPLRIKVLGNTLLIGTKKRGVIIIDKHSFKILKTIKLPIASPVLDIAILKDSIWVATGKSGILTFSKENFDQVTYFNSENSDFKADGALCLNEDKNGNLLIGTDGKGLFVYNKKEFYQIVKRPNPNSLKSNAIRTIFVDNQNNIWLGTYASGVNLQPFLNRAIKNYQNDFTSKNSLSKSFVLAIEESKNDKLYIGTDRGGIEHFRE